MCSCAFAIPVMYAGVVVGVQLHKCWRCTTRKCACLALSSAPSCAHVVLHDCRLCPFAGATHGQTCAQQHALTSIKIHSHYINVIGSPSLVIHGDLGCEGRTFAGWARSGQTNGQNADQGTRNALELSLLIPSSIRTQGCALQRAPTRLSSSTGSLLSRPLARRSSNTAAWRSAPGATCS